MAFVERLLTNGNIMVKAYRKYRRLGDFDNLIGVFIVAMPSNHPFDHNNHSAYSVGKTCQNSACNYRFNAL